MQLSAGAAGTTGILAARAARAQLLLERRVRARDDVAGNVEQVIGHTRNFDSGRASRQLLIDRIPKQTYMGARAVHSETGL